MGGRIKRPLPSCFFVWSHTICNQTINRLTFSLLTISMLIVRQLIVRCLIIRRLIVYCRIIRRLIISMPIISRLIVRIQIIRRLIVSTQTISCLTVRHLTVFWACARRWELELELELSFVKFMLNFGAGAGNRLRGSLFFNGRKLSQQAGSQSQAKSPNRQALPCQYKHGFHIRLRAKTLPTYKKLSTFYASSYWTPLSFDVYSITQYFLLVKLIPCKNKCLFRFLHYNYNQQNYLEIYQTEPSNDIQ